MLIKTTAGNVLWDCIAYIDDETVQQVRTPVSLYAPCKLNSGQIRNHGGLKAIVISHPHFYTTNVEWAHAFGCPVYTSEEDVAWLQRRDAPGVERRLIRGATETVLPGVTAIKTGGHFDGSLVLHWEHSLFIADSLLTVQASVAAQTRGSRATDGVPRLAPSSLATIITTGSQESLHTRSCGRSPTSFPSRPTRLRPYGRRLSHGLLRLRTGSRRAGICMGRTSRSGCWRAPKSRFVRKDTPSMDCLPRRFPEAQPHYGHHLGMAIISIVQPQGLHALGFHSAGSLRLSALRLVPCPKCPFVWRIDPYCAALCAPCTRNMTLFPHSSP